ncbi:hypothetical protein [Robertkochia aurantiaca]|uniref:hypothetical protein n=1 Tax=Robertkochia aurantiaca TaxID=2873700 RepID=UPI001CCCECAF|nr:hypothetical protein [Robertkochia sp. 3YJGBD-33]
MKRILPVLMLLLITTSVMAQRKSELFARIDTLNAELRTTKSELAESERKLAGAQTRVSTLEMQMEQLRETNQGLLDNLNNFIQSSTERTNNIGQTLESLQQKEAQLKAIRDKFSSHDSLAFKVLTDLKKTLGEDAQMGVENGKISIKIENEDLFGTNNAEAKIAESQKAYLQKISEIIKKYQSLSVTIETKGLDNQEILARRAGALAEFMATEYEVTQERLRAMGRVSLAEGTYIRLHPAFDGFYLWMREHLKNGL